MSSDSKNPIFSYFSEFKLLKDASKNFWITNFIQFFDGLAYFSMIHIFTIFLNKYCGFDDASSSLWVGLYTLFISAFVFAVGTICDIIGIKKSYAIGFVLILVGRLLLGFGTDVCTKWWGWEMQTSSYFVMAGIFIMLLLVLTGLAWMVQLMSMMKFLQPPKAITPYKSKKPPTMFLWMITRLLKYC